jgi:hypothetical protein
MILKSRLEGGKRNTRRLGFGNQTGDTGSAARRESARKNTGRNEREGASAGAGSSGVDSRAGVVGLVTPVAVAGVTWTAVVSGWSTVDVEMRFPSLPPSIGGGVVVIRSRDV